MDLLPTADQQAMVEAMAKLLARELTDESADTRRATVSSDHDRLWSACAGFGVLGLGVPERLGGSGAGVPDEALVFRELGRFLAPGPFLSSVVGAHLAALAGRAATTKAVVSGERRVAAAILARDGRLGPGSLRGRGWLLDGPGADLALVAGTEGMALVPCDLACRRQRVPCLDPSVVLESVEFDATAVEPYLDGADARRLRCRAEVLAAALMVGLAEATRDRAADHAKQREQFGRPIGAQQAVKHRCADMAVRAAAAGAQVSYAALCLEEGDEHEAVMACAAAWVVARRAAMANAAANIQLHGAMGVTAEHVAHLYLKKAHVVDVWMGGGAHALSRLVDERAAP